MYKFIRLKILFLLIIILILISSFATANIIYGGIINQSINKTTLITDPTGSTLAGWTSQVGNDANRYYTKSHANSTLNINWSLFMGDGSNNQRIAFTPSLTDNVTIAFWIKFDSVGGPGSGTYSSGTGNGIRWFTEDTCGGFFASGYDTDYICSNYSSNTNWNYVKNYIVGGVAYVYAGTSPDNLSLVSDPFSVSAPLMTTFRIMANPNYLKVADFIIYNGTTNPYSPIVSPINDTLNISSYFPNNSSQFNYSNVNYNITFNTVVSSGFCNLSLNGAWVKTLNWTGLGTINLNTTIDFSTYGSNTYNSSFYCDNGVSNESTSTFIYYIDLVFPSISTTFINNSVFFLNNLTATFNFSDDFYLNSYNISIDNMSISSLSNLSGTFHQVNISENIKNLSSGIHYLSVSLADGHTASSIPDYKISTGLFNNKMSLTYNDHGSEKEIKISQEKSSIFDTFEVYKLKDRYSWNFLPSNKKKSVYTFEIETDDQIRIINDNSTYLKSWITFGNKWIDFEILNETPIINIKRVSTNKVKVSISNVSNPSIQRFNSIGDLNIITANYTFYTINANVVYQPTLFQGSYTPYILTINGSNISFNNSAILYWNNTYKSTTLTNISFDQVRHNVTFIVPDLFFDHVNWTYYFNVSGYPFNISGNSSFIAMNITNCTSSDYLILNYTLYDEKLRIVPTGVNSTIENYLTLKNPDNSSFSYNFSIKTSNTTLLICLPNQTLDYGSFILDATTKYYYDDHVEEFHYIENFLLTSLNIPSNIHLYDLDSTTSTSYIISYQNEGYLYIEGVIVDLLRQYTSNSGNFISVEHGKTDEGGQTILHLVDEDVIYKANVWLDGVLEYTTQDFQALCQTTPCQINLRKPYDASLITDKFENILFSITNQETFYNTRAITFDFSTNDGTASNIKMNVTLSTNNFNNTLCSDELSSSSGSVTCNIPLAYYNSTYTARIYKDGDFIGWRTYSLEPDSDEIFGRFGIFLALIGYLTLTFIGISSPIASITFGTLGLICMSLMNLIVGGSIIGVGSSILWLIIACGILIYKFQMRKVQ